MSGTETKITRRTMSFTANDRPRVRTRSISSRGTTDIVLPPVAISRVVLDALEAGVEVPEFLPDAFDKRTDIGAITVISGTCNKAFAMHEVVQLAVLHVGTGVRGKVMHHLELGER